MKRPCDWHQWGDFVADASFFATSTFHARRAASRHRRSRRRTVRARNRVQVGPCLSSTASCNLSTSQRKLSTHIHGHPTATSLPRSQFCFLHPVTHPEDLGLRCFFHLFFPNRVHLSHLVLTTTNIPPRTSLVLAVLATPQSPFIHTNHRHGCSQIPHAAPRRRRRRVFND